VTSNRFWSQIFGIAFSNNDWTALLHVVRAVMGLWTQAASAFIGLALQPACV